MAVTLTLTYGHKLSSNFTVIITYSYRYRCPIQPLTNGSGIVSHDKFTVQRKSGCIGQKSTANSDPFIHDSFDNLTTSWQKYL